MHYATRQPVTRPDDRSRQRHPKALVVDPNAGDYVTWSQVADARGVELQIVGTTAEALRISRGERVDLWIVSAELPGISGIELCSMLKAPSPAVPVYLVADSYSPDVERAARQARATLFGVKGEHHAWFDAWAAQHAPQPKHSKC